MGKGPNLTKEELEFIKVHVLDKSTQEIADELNRNYWTIHRALQKIGANNNHKFTPDEDYMIKKLYKSYGAKYIATKLGIDETAVYNRVKKLGIRKNKEKK